LQISRCDEHPTLIAKFGRFLPNFLLSHDRSGLKSERNTASTRRETFELLIDIDSESLRGRQMAKAKKASKKKPREIVVVGSKVKDVVRSAGLRSDGELVQAVSEKVHDLLEAAIGRAQDNKRGTVRPYDL
jgi:hypothetical protein